MTNQKIQTAEYQIPMPGGARKFRNGYCFTVEAPEKAEVSLLLYHRKAEEPTEIIPFSEENRVGRFRTMYLPEFSARDMEYNFCIDGKVYQDPYACRINGREAFGEDKKEKPHQVRCGFSTGASYDWEGDASPKIPNHELVLYKLHVRGYTKASSGGGKKRGTFAGLMDKISYWKELGINAVELMPAYEFEEMPAPAETDGMVSHRQETGRVNFWGYLPGNYFAPKKSYCAGKSPETEVKNFIKALHQAGIECIMEFFFPAGTSPLLALHALQFWKINYHVDGFHILGDGAPVELILNDGILAGSRQMAPYFDMNRINQGNSSGEQLLAEYNVRYMEDMRRFLKSDECMAETAAYHIRRSNAQFSYVNYMTCQDGFTLNDLVTYMDKHNEANGEENHDGSDYNFSWNCGEEGPSRKTAIRKTREQQIRNAFLLMLLSQGIPMIYAGDEMGNTQEGNNNAYCQDNPLGWIDWKSAHRHSRRTEFVREAIAFRKEHPILHLGEELKGTDYLAKGYPDISFHGERAWYCSYSNTCRLLGVMLNGSYAVKESGEPDDFLYIGYNFHWEPRTLALPNLPEKMVWNKVADTSEDRKANYFYDHMEEHKKTIEVAPRSIVILIGKSGG